jgi:hypothetical protein
LLAGGSRSPARASLIAATARPKRVASLVTQDTMPCEHCGEIIDLGEGENAIVIEELAEQCTIIDEKIATHV